MARLSSRALASLNQAILGLHATESAEEFSWQIHVAIRALIPGDIVGEMTSIGTLFAFILV